MASFTAVSLCDALHRAVFLDEFPEDAAVAAALGMLHGDKNVVLGTWQCIVRNGLAPRQKVMAAIRTRTLKAFFHAQHERLLVTRVSLSWALLAAFYKFDNTYELAADPPLDVERELTHAENEACDAYAVPRFQTPRSQAESWNRVDELATLLLEQGGAESASRLKGVLRVYKEARELYNIDRQPPAAIVAVVEAAFPDWRDE